MLRLLTVVLGLTLSWAGGQSQAAGPYELPDRNRAALRPLRLLQSWSLQPPTSERFDASALLLQTNGSLLTLNDKRAGLYRIDLPPSGSVAALVRLPGAFEPDALDAAVGRKARNYDLEGLAEDNQGRWYTCEESTRLVFRYNPQNQQTEVLRFDWSPVQRWFSRGGNSSWEGIAVAGETLYLANEREVGRIVVASLANRTVTGSFSVAPPDRPARDVHYSDLCWFQNHLWVLCRESHCVLQVNPQTERVVAAFDYSHIERDPQHGYLNPLPYGFVEGLAVASEVLWLVVDNNGIGRISNPQDSRPSLWKCEIPPPRTPTQPSNSPRL
jgi:hypothetical protein